MKNSFKFVLSQESKKGIKTMKSKDLTIKKNQTLFDKAIEITNIFAHVRSEQLIRGSKFVDGINLGTSFKIGIEKDGNLFQYKGLGFFTNTEMVKLSFAVKEQIRKGEIVATKCDVFTKRAELIAKQIYLTLCDAYGESHGLTIEGSNDMNSIVSKATRKLLK